MCYGNAALPPEHGIAGGVASEADLVLTSADGTWFSAHLARPAKPSGIGMVVMPDVRGLHSFYCALTRSFAEAGVEAVAFDYFGRSAGLTDGRPEDFDYATHVKQVDFAKVAEDTTAAIQHLGTLGTVERVFTVGFCMGGAMSWRQSADQPGLAGAIGFYGVPGRARDRLPDMKAPLLMLLAGDDKATSSQEFEKFERELGAAGVDHRAITYPGAPHSFFDRTYAEHAAACADSWKQIFEFTGIPAAA